jgi:hypothetical protein
MPSPVTPPAIWSVRCFLASLSTHVVSASVTIAHLDARAEVHSVGFLLDKAHLLVCRGRCPGPALRTVGVTVQCGDASLLLTKVSHG